MIPKFLNFSNKNKGSSLMSPANGLGGSRATTLLFFPKSAAAPAGQALKQKGKKEGGWGKGIFALLRLELERFRFSLIKRKPKQKFFHLLLKEKNGGQKKIKNVMKKFLFWFAVAERRQAETHRLNYQFSRSVRFSSEPPRTRSVVSRGSVQKKLEFQPKGTASWNFTRNQVQPPPVCMKYLGIDLGSGSYIWR